MAKMYLMFILSTMLVNTINVESFDVLKQHSPMFVDKTKFLDAFFAPAKSHRCIYLTAPPGFGKTTLASMVDQFAGVEIDADNTTFKAAFFTETFKIFKETKASPSTNHLGAHLSKYLIIRITVEFRPEESSYMVFEPIYEALQKMVATAAERYENFLNAYVNNMHEEEKEFLIKLSNSKLSKSELPYALRSLIKIFHKYSSHSTILLIDDHDRAAYGITSKSLNPHLELFYKIFNTMIDFATKLGPKYVHKAMITSTYSLPFYWSGETGRELTDFHHYEFLKEHVFTQFVGFTLPEVGTISRKLEWSFNDIFELTIYCNGFLSSYNMTRFYKPKCIENYIHSRLPTKISDESYDVDYRSTFRDLEHLKPYFKACDFEIQLLILSYNKTVAYPHFGVLGRAGVSIDEFKDLLDPAKSNKTNSIAYRFMWNYLKEYGIITRHRDSDLHYKIPNAEVSHALNEFIFRYHDESKFALNEIAKCLQILALSHNDLTSELIKTAIHDLGVLFTYCDQNITGIYTKRAHEVIFQAILYASTFRTAWRYYPNYEVNYRPLGRCDMYLYNKQENVAAIVNIEYQGSLVILPNIFTTQFPHPSISVLTVLSINIKKKGLVEVSHSIREVGPKRK